MLAFHKINADNLEYAVSIQEEIFPNESGRFNFEDAVSGKSDFEYELLYFNDQCVGVIGIYHYEIDPQSAWLGWFGIREPYRRLHLGSEAIAHFESLAREKGYRYARLYTDEYDNETAIAFYKANGYTCERYENENDPLCFKWRMLIFSKALNDDELTPWNNRNINLTHQLSMQEEAQKLKHETRNESETGSL